MNDKQTKLFEAINSHNHEILSFLLNDGDVSPDSIYDVDGEKCPAIVMAAEKNNIYAVKLLLEKGADINAKNSYGQAALIFSIRHEESAMFDLLVEKGADVNVVSDDGTPLMVAVLFGYNQRIEKLFQAGADLEKEDKWGFTALTYAFYHPDCEAQIEFLLELGANMHHRGENASHMLEVARQEQNFETIDWFQSYLENKALTGRIEEICDKNALLMF